MSDQGESLLEILDELYDIVVNAKICRCPHQF